MIIIILINIRILAVAEQKKKKWKFDPTGKEPRDICVAALSGISTSEV